MTATPNLQLPYIAAAQAQKHVTHNEALRIIDALAQLAVIDRDLAGPPAEPEDGDRYIVAAAPTGAWAGRANHIAAWQDGAWQFSLPRAGWIAFVIDEARFHFWDGSAWLPAQDAITALQNLVLLGIGTAADAENPFSAKLNKALWTARYDGEGGDGDLRYTLNKQAPGDILSLLMQSDWSARAEIGLVGNDDLTLKVSPDGAAFHEGLVIDRASGAARFPNGIVHPETGLRGALYIPAPIRELWRLDVSRPAIPRTFTIDSVSGANLTLTTASVDQIFSSFMRGNAAVRVWNTSKSPAQAAWVDWNNSTTQLRVTDAAHIAGWANGETLRLGDPNPTGDNTQQMVALDIGNYLFNELGVVFPQRGVMLNVQTSSSDGPSMLAFSPSGATGTLIAGNALSNGVRNSMCMPIPTSVASPISASNLLFVRETLAAGASDLTISFGRVLGVYF